MQGSKVRRSLDSFAPFRPDEMVESAFFSKDDNCHLYSYYPTYGGRLRVARTLYPSLSIKTRVHVAELRSHAIICAEVSGVSSDGKPAAGAGIGTADKTGDARLMDSLTELAETRAIGRALRSMGVGAEFVSAEEAIRPLFSAPLAATAPLATPAPSAAVAPPHPTSSAQPTLPPAAATGRAKLGAELLEQVGGVREKAQLVLNAIIPGRTSPAQLSDHELDICRLVLDAAVICDTPAIVAVTKTALMTAIRATVPVEGWSAAHVLAAREAIRGKAPAPGHSAATISPDDVPF